MSAIRYEKDDQNILTLTIDMPGQSANTMNADFREAFRATLAKVAAEADSLQGIILTSAKKTFFAGGDLNEIYQVNTEQAQSFFEMVSELKRQMRQLETLGKPLVAAINGTALGGGYELCLACHHRIALADDSLRIGLPEVTLGLLPGGGGTLRLPRLIGLEKAFPFLLEGKKVGAKDALKAGLVDDLAANPEELMTKARTWILAHPSSQQPWDQKGYKMPGGSPATPAIAQMLAIAPAMLRNKTKGCYPAPEAILSAAVEGAQVDFDTAEKIETRYFTQLVTGQVAKNMIGTLWFQLNAIKAGGSRPQGIERQKVQKLGILGAGMMGAGIAYAAATRGLQVVLKDVGRDQANQGKAYTEKLLAKKVAKGQMTSEASQSILDRILPTGTYADLQGCDLIIEAVFEDSALKAQVTHEAEPQLASQGMFASNTSTIPITQLAQASARPENFIGLHFFSPVDKMPLVEIIVGAKTSDITLARAFDFVLQIDKTPIVVNDSRGFFTSRVFGTYVNEGLALLSEGYHPATIENAALLAGMPVGPLAVCDEVSLSLMQHVRNQSRRDLEAEGGTWQAHPAERVLDEMIERFNRKGKAAGSGFYDYPPGGRKHLWSGLSEHYLDSSKVEFTDLQYLQDRLLFIQALETLRCIDEGVLREVRDANIGSIFGLGFAPWTGGAVQFVNQYGPEAFAQRADQLARELGGRFRLPECLKTAIAAGQLLV